MLPRRDGLLRAPEWDTSYTRSIGDVAREGDRIDVMVTDMQPDGKFRLSRKAALLADAASDSAADAGEEEGGDGDGLPPPPPGKGDRPALKINLSS